MYSLDWYRDGDFFALHNGKVWTNFLEKTLGVNCYISNRVEFRKNYSKTIKRIQVLCTTEGEKWILLTPNESINAKDTFHDLCRKKLATNAFFLQEAWPYSVIVKFDSLETLQKVASIAPEDITREMNYELRALFDGLAAKHTIKEGDCVTSWVNPKLVDSKQLVTQLKNLYYGYDNGLTHQANIMHFESMLVSGQDVNQRDQESDESPLFYAITHPCIIYTYLLLCYGANPLLRNGKTFFASAREITIREKLWIHLRLIDLATFPTPKKLLSQRKLIITETIRENDQMITIFKFTKHPISTRLIRWHKKTVENLNLKEEMFKIFKACFTHLEEKHVRAKFEDAFDFDHNKLVERIYDANHQLIGLNNLDIFEIVDENTIVLHCAYGCLNSANQGQGLMPILAFRLGFSLRELYKDKVAIFFSPLELSAYSVMNVSTNILHLPKHQAEHSPRLIDKILKRIYKEDQLKVIHKQMTWGIVEENTLKVKTPKFNRVKNPLLSWFFDNYIKDPSVEDMIPACLFYVTDESFDKFYRLTYQMGIDCLDFVTEQAHALLPFAESILGRKADAKKSKKAVVKFHENTAAFWLNIAKEIEKPVSAFPHPPIASLLG